jgi:hypothetical protein
MASKKRSSRSARPKVFHVALFLRDGSIVEANVAAPTGEEAASILTAVGARFLPYSYATLRREIVEALAGKGATAGLPLVTLNKDSPMPHVAPPVRQARSGSKRPTRRSSRRSSRRSRK